MKKGIFILFAVLFLTGCSQSDQAGSDSAASTQASSSSVSQSSVSTNTTQSSVSQTTDGKEVSFSVEDAIATFQKNLPDVDITEIEFDQKLGKEVFEITGVDDNKEYEWVIDANNQEILEKESEALDAEEKEGQKRQEKLNLKELISLSEASDIAVKEIGSGTAVDWQLDQELGQTYWEVKVKDGNRKIEVKLDAQSGEILEKKLDD